MVPWILGADGKKAGFPRRRPALALAILAPLVAGCGFHPLYGRSGQAVVEPQLAAVKIMPIPEHTGQLLEWRLETDFNPDGAAVAPRYALHVALGLRENYLATAINAVSTRGSISAAAEIALTTLDGKTVLYHARIQSIADFNIESDAYAAAIGKSGAEKRVIADIGQEIEARLAAYFADRAATQ
jgi:LPS-assembly lipoprotein